MGASVKARCRDSRACAKEDILCLTPLNRPSDKTLWQPLHRAAPPGGNQRALLISILSVTSDVFVFTTSPRLHFLSIKWKRVGRRGEAEFRVIMGKKELREIRDDEVVLKALLNLDF